MLDEPKRSATLDRITFTAMTANTITDREALLDLTSGTTTSF